MFARHLTIIYNTRHVVSVIIKSVYKNDDIPYKLLLLQKRRRMNVVN